MPNSKQSDTSNYSVNYLKLAAFTDELNNYLMVIEQTVKEETSDIYYQRQDIINYFEQRISELKKLTSK